MAAFSIHSPIMWARLSLPCNNSLSQFQSTRPIRGETKIFSYTTYKTYWFQSTHSVWGETINGEENRLQARISIHSPLVGRDRPYRAIIRYRIFNPLGPYRARPDIFLTWSIFRSFQSTRPYGMRPDRRDIGAYRKGNFNPLTPCGVRPERGDKRREPLVFQSTHPVWGETAKMNKIFISAMHSYM